ncbi:MAG: hypothetical protein P3A28_09565 [Gemmatimonadota bacterium]|nr:hypothetical protein [Gemmatimonadota bacterium]
MTGKPPVPDLERVPSTVAERILARASELDANSAHVAELRSAAAEAGISASAFDAALAEYREGARDRVTARVPEYGTRRRGLIATLIAFLAVGALFFFMRVVPNSVQVADPYSTRIPLNCTTPDAAAALARSMLDDRTSTIQTGPGNITISAPTQEQIDRVREAIAQRERSAGCTLPDPRNSPPSR